MRSISRLPMTLETRVNGEIRQSDISENLRFSFAALIHYISQFATLAPGDLISTGSPSGAGGGPFGYDPPRWLRPGDLLEITVSGIGTLRNTVANEGLPDRSQP
jgi:2-keto-4-pentenoate hydratase/2-oxohepta-3-ene-1,7-dioic acid hydratase in catechol pathway